MPSKNLVAILVLILLMFLLQGPALADSACPWDIIKIGASNGRVDEVDRTELNRCYNPLGQVATGCQTVDLNHDNVVNALDYSILLTHWGNCPWQTLSPTPTPTTVTGLCPPSWDNFSDAVVTEKIVFAIESETATRFPDYRSRAQQMVDFTNNVLSKNTRKRYAIEKFITYPIDQYVQIAQNPDYHFDNGYGGTTISYYLNPVNGPAQNVIDSGLVNVAQLVTINDRRFYNIWLVVNEAGGFQINNDSMGTPLHELGHSLGLGSAEWYLFNFDDLTGRLPNLGHYDYGVLYPKDPMVHTGTTGYEFSNFNAYIINHNPLHQYSFYNFSDFFSQQVIVRVKNSSGNPVPNASVTVFGAKKNCYYCNPLAHPTVPLQELTTDTNGETIIDNVNPEFWMNESPQTGWVAKIIKVSQVDKNNGTVFTLVEAQKSCVIDGVNAYYIDINI